jgi:hypothetical protein
MDIIIKVSDINGAVISKNLLLLLDTIKAGILLMQNYCRYSSLDFDTVDNRFNYGGNIYKDYDENRPLIAV